ncbi:TetR/AcrR family transcriptional regulator [Gordonia phthalatica]|uniref:TetR/AcrR family transcriptional regulator n=1 Tax=Gordonia phthalatica TaxID=1136941 RepID=UPI000B338E77|nr:TetR/AcrR family transcriptional regulator [Gordonia phthalatica]
MSPRALDPAVREALSEAAVRILGTEGRDALSSRRLAREAGTSTTAVYTYFGGMDELHRHVRRRELDALVHRLDVIDVTEDPVADLAGVSAVYIRYGADHRSRYRVMFVDQPPDDEHDPAERVFDRFRAAVEACVTVGRFHPDVHYSPALWAGEIWAACHGAAMLAATDLLPPSQIDTLAADLVYRMCVGFGDDPVRARASVNGRFGEGDNRRAAVRPQRGEHGAAT